MAMQKFSAAEWFEDQIKSVTSTVQTMEAQIKQAETEAVEVDALRVSLFAANFHKDFKGYYDADIKACDEMLERLHGQKHTSEAERAEAQHRLNALEFAQDLYKNRKQ